MPLQTPCLKRNIIDLGNQLIELMIAKAVKYASVVDGCSGDKAIADRWHSHFEDLYNSTRDIMSEVQFRARLPLNVNASSY